MHDFPRFQDLETRITLVAEEINRLKPSIVFLQEIPWTMMTGEAAQMMAGLTGMNYVYLRANGNRNAILFEEGEAILSRFPLRNPRGIELRPKPGLFEHRVAIGVTIVTPQGSLAAVSVHLTNGEEALNKGQAYSLRTFVESFHPHPVLVAGDFNALEREAHMLDLAEGWLDLFRKLHPNEPGYTCCVDDLHSNPDEPLEERIDYIFLAPGISSDLEVIEASLVFAHPISIDGIWQWPSDHIGLYAVLEFE